MRQKDGALRNGLFYHLHYIGLIGEIISIYVLRKYHGEQPLEWVGS